VKLLVDANLSPKVAELLSAAGFEATHVRDHDLLTAPDEEISAYAVAHDQVIVSSDSDFASMLALSGRTSPSLVLMRSADAMTPTEQGHLLVNNLPTVAESLGHGAVVSISRLHLRVRRLPLRSAGGHVSPNDLEPSP
jgi:predicted nuclease of predicted toxin-antitoxin system